jgi:hypothetical protein
MKKFIFILFGLAAGTMVFAAPVSVTFDVSAERAAWSSIRSIADSRIAYIDSLKLNTVPPPAPTPVPTPPPSPTPVGVKVLPDTSTQAEYFRITSPGSYLNPTVSVTTKLDHFYGSDANYSGHGLGVFLRYQSEYHLYLAYYNQISGKAVIKKKCPGGSSNNGTYYNLSSFVDSGFPSKQDVKVEAKVFNENGNVKIELRRNGVLLVTGLDTGQGCARITSAGKVGMRSDVAVFSFKDFIVK